MTPPPLLLPPNFSHRTILGNRGEHLAADFLTQAGLTVLARNIHCGHPELDLVCFEPTSQEVVFVEVKTRGSGYFGPPAAAVKPLKLLHLRQATGRFLREHSEELAQLRWNGDFRIDVIAIEIPRGQQPQIEWTKNVTL